MNKHPPSHPHSHITMQCTHTQLHWREGQCKTQFMQLSHSLNYLAYKVGLRKKANISFWQGWITRRSLSEQIYFPKLSTFTFAYKADDRYYSLTCPETEPWCGYKWSTGGALVLRWSRDHWPQASEPPRSGPGEPIAASCQLPVREGHHSSAGITAATPRHQHYYCTSVM